MPFDESLAVRIRSTLGCKKGIVEKKMFGSLVFLLHGNMLVGIWKNSLIVRLGPDQAEEAFLEPNVKEFDVTGKPMKGWIMVQPAGVLDEDAVKVWVQRATKFVAKLPAK